MQKLWQPSPQRLLTFNQNHARHLPPDVPPQPPPEFLFTEIKAVLSFFFSLPPLLIFFHAVESLHKGEPDPRSSPSKYLQDEIKLLFETYIISLSPHRSFIPSPPLFFPLSSSAQFSFPTLQERISRHPVGVRRPRRS